jgi:tripartite-type tricarboxylate transporter receptor subunit TctC
MLNAQEEKGTMTGILAHLAAAVLVAALPAAALAQAWPTKPVKMIVPVAAGGATDVVARLLAQKLTEEWGQSVVVENRAGAGGNIGGDAVAKSSPDGYTLLMASGAIVIAGPHMYKSLPYDPVRDLVAITNVATGPQVIAVATNVPAKDLRELIAYAKANPKAINYGSAGIGAQTHLAAENFAHAAGIELTHVPYKGESAALTDLMGGQIQLVTAPLSLSSVTARCARSPSPAASATRRCPTCPRHPKCCQGSRTPDGSACWRRPERRRKSSTRSIATRRRSCCRKSFAASSRSWA